MRQAATGASDSPEPPPAISVIGLGKLGAPLAAVFAFKGIDVVGVDRSAETVASLNAGRAPVAEPGLQELIEAAKPRLRATREFEEAILSSSVTFVVVPTPSASDGSLDNRHVLSVVGEVGTALRRKSSYHLVVISSTVVPGSTDGVIRAELERSSGRSVGPALGLCYSPEFIALGSVIRNILEPDLILIGESDPRAGDLLREIHLRCVENRPEIFRMASINAELCKIAINTFVTMKISFANLFAELCDELPGADVEVVTRAAGADRRIGREFLRGAVGYGGPCFPRDNRALAALGRALHVPCELAAATDQVNERQVVRLLRAVRERADRGATVAVLGMSYKPATAVIEESQGVALARALLASGFEVIVSDPLATGAALEALDDRVRARTAGEAVSEAQVTVIVTPHAEYRSLPRSAFAGESRQKTVLDPWRILDPERLEGVADLVIPGRG